MKVGVVGAGFIGRTHIRAAKAVPDIEITGYVDPFAKADHPDLAGLISYPSLEAMLESGVQGVIVAVPDEFHVPIAKQCLIHGAAVLLEKPAATSLLECVDLSLCTPDVEHHLLVGHQRRHHPTAQLTKQLIRDNALGRLIGVGGVFALKKEANYFIERPRSVGLTNLIHDLDILQYFCGRLESVSASVSHLARGAKEVDTIALVMNFENGLVGSMIATDSSPSPWGWDQSTKELPSIPYNSEGTTYSLLGTEGSLAIPNMRLHKHGEGQNWHHDLISESLGINESNAYENQLAHFAEVMSGKAYPIVSIHDALATQAGLDAVYLSAQEQRTVSIQGLIEEAREQLKKAAYAPA